MAAARDRIAVCGLMIGSALCVLEPAAGQAAGEPYLAAVTQESVLVRSGADARYYPFGQVVAGDVVRVVGEKSGWARVATEGPAFGEFFGFVKHPRTEAALFEVSPDGLSGVTTAPIDLFAPNLDAQFDPSSSWKPTMTLPPQRTLRILETVVLEGEVVHRVVLPPDAQGWIELASLRPATPVEIASWEAALAEVGPPPPPQATAPEVPVVPVTQPALGAPKANVGAAIEADQAPAPMLPAATAAAPPTAPAVKPKDPRVLKRTAEQRLAQIMLEDLEAAYARLMAEPLEEAEVEPLRQLYVDLAGRNPGSRPITHYASVRAKQLALWAEAQDQKIAIAELRARARKTAQDAEAARLVLEANAEYVAVGRLEASTLYDGTKLPKLLRLRDPATGRSLGYLVPDEKFQTTMLVGKDIAIVGETFYHGGYQVNVIKPVRVDVMGN